MIDPIAPKWSRELVRFLPSKSQFILWGNVHDVYPLRWQGAVATFRMADLLAAVLREQGCSLIVRYEPLVGFSIMSGGDDGQADVLAQLTGLDCRSGAAQADLSKAAQAIEALVMARDARCAVLLDFASRIPDLCSGSGNDVEAFFYRMFRLMGDAAPKLPRDAGAAPGVLPTPLFSPVIWILDKENDLPSWYALNGARLRSLPIPKPGHDVRRFIVESIAPRMDGWDDMDEASRHEAMQLFVSQTTGLFASELIAIRQLARREGLGLSEIGEAVRRYQLGITEDLWAELDRSRIRDAEAHLSRSVMGQDRAVRHVADVLKRSVYGLSGAQTSRWPQRPKGVLFFAGPTGVGKTELAKAITELVFGSPTRCIRFDMSEFAHEHADQRLIGAPPGYVGYDVGGELTNAIKQDPFSVILFDEIEKAAPKILDVFLQILDDGRLTSGRGETVWFSETLIIFTSNLGVYEQLPDGSRRQAIGPGASYEELEQKLHGAIQGFFRDTIQRPEILNRIGKNIVVFDFIREDGAERIFDKMLGNVSRRLEDVHGIRLSLSEGARAQLLEEARRDLSMGGRGVGNAIEEALIDPLSRALFERAPGQGPVVVESAVKGPRGWELMLRG